MPVLLCSALLLGPATPNARHIIIANLATARCLHSNRIHPSSLVIEHFSTAELHPIAHAVIFIMSCCIRAIV